MIKCSACMTCMTQTGVYKLMAPEKPKEVKGHQIYKTTERSSNILNRNTVIKMRFVAPKPTAIFALALQKCINYEQGHLKHEYSIIKKQGTRILERSSLCFRRQSFTNSLKLVTEICNKILKKFRQ